MHVYYHTVTVVTVPMWDAFIGMITGLLTNCICSYPGRVEITDHDIMNQMPSHNIIYTSINNCNQV